MHTENSQKQTVELVNRLAFLPQHRWAYHWEDWEWRDNRHRKTGVSRSYTKWSSFERSFSATERNQR